MDNAITARPERTWNCRASWYV